MADLVHDLDNTSKVVNQPKAIYAGDSYSDQPLFLVTNDAIIAAASKTQGIIITEDFGVTLSGKISFRSNPDQMSFGFGYWRLNPLVLSCLPSTSATPIPMLVRSTPELLQSASALSDSLSILDDNGL